MTRPFQPVDPKEWERASRGRRIQFFATDEDVNRWLAELPDEFAPYRIISLDKRKSHDGSYEDVWSLREPRVGGPEWSHWLCSQVLHGAPHEALLAGVDSRSLTLSGLLHLQHGLRMADGRRDESSLSVVDRVARRGGVEERHHLEALRLFERMRRRIRRDLSYFSTFRLDDGTTVDSTAVLWTKAAAELALSHAEDFVAEPGGLLKPRA